MKTSLNTAAICCAAFGRNAERAGKYSVDTLARMSCLSVLHEPKLRSIPAGLPGIHQTSFMGTTLNDARTNQGEPISAMQLPSDWRHDSDSRIPGKRVGGNVMRIQETLPSQALAVA